jgi:Transposase DDE domain group 1
MQPPDGEFGPLPRHGVAGRRGRDQIGARAWCRPFLLDASDTDCRSDADAAFAMPEVYEFLEAERINYAIRLPANQVLQHRIGYLLKRPVGRPSNEVFPCQFTYQAGSCGELYPRVGFIVTNLARPADRVVAFYNKRGTCVLIAELRPQPPPAPA